jgi:hypothetical protein
LSIHTNKKKIQIKNKDFFMPYKPIVGTLGYILSHDHSKVLMVHRLYKENDDHLGKYNGLGGKMENEEDAVRARLEPIIKTWSEEHGKKKQLRALLASLHTVLWPESGWKPVGLGDLLDDKKCKLYFHKASRVVHPDKTMELSIENRFLANSRSVHCPTRRVLRWRMWNTDSPWRSVRLSARSRGSTSQAGLSQWRRCDGR